MNPTVISHSIRCRNIGHIPTAQWPYPGYLAIRADRNLSGRDSSFLNRTLGKGLKKIRLVRLPDILAWPVRFAHLVSVSKKKWVDTYLTLTPINLNFFWSTLKLRYQKNFSVTQPYCKPIFL